MMIRILSALLALFIFGSCGTEKISTGDEYEQVTLPDSSVIYLNKNSSLTFNKSFKERKVELEGEAYFAIEPDSIPFTVSTDDGDIEVLGTTFSILSRGNKLKVEVETGEVKMKVKGHDRGLHKGQRGYWEPGRSSIELGRADLDFKVWLKDMEVSFGKSGRPFKAINPSFYRGRGKWKMGSPGKSGGNGKLKIKPGKGLKLSPGKGKGNGAKGKGKGKGN